MQQGKFLPHACIFLVEGQAHRSQALSAWLLLRKDTREGVSLYEEGSSFSTLLYLNDSNHC